MILLRGSVLTRVDVRAEGWSEVRARDEAAEEEAEEE